MDDVQLLASARENITTTQMKQEYDMLFDAIQGTILLNVYITNTK